MKSKSAKAKGRRFQQEIVAFLKECDPSLPISSTVMGLNGSDIQDPTNALPWTYIECRNREQWPTLDGIHKEMISKAGDCWMATYKRNRQAPIFVMDVGLFHKLLRVYLEKEKHGTL